MPDLLKSLMKEKGVSVTQMSRDTGIPQSTISEWIGGKYRPKADKLVVLAKYFGVSLESLIEGRKEG
jgi:repressor LexA